MKSASILFVASILTSSLALASTGEVLLKCSSQSDVETPGAVVKLQVTSMASDNTKAKLTGSVIGTRSRSVTPIQPVTGTYQAAGCDPDGVCHGFDTFNNAQQAVSLTVNAETMAGEYTPGDGGASIAVDCSNN